MVPTFEIIVAWACFKLKLNPTILPASLVDCFLDLQREEYTYYYSLMPMSEFANGHCLLSLPLLDGAK